MLTANEQRLRSWLYVLGWVGIIYSTLYIVRPICTFLKETTPFALLVNILCGIVILSVLTVLWRKAGALKFSSYFILAVVLIGYGYGLAAIAFPEEKIHFIEYGMLAYLIYKALRLDVRDSKAYVLTFLLVSALGWIDEGIQHILPNRYYQIEDVILNSVSGVLGLALVYVFQRGR
jgi:hypothetical protein